MEINKIKLARYFGRIPFRKFYVINIVNNTFKQVRGFYAIDEKTETKTVVFINDSAKVFALSTCPVYYKNLIIASTIKTDIHKSIQILRKKRNESKQDKTRKTRTWY